MYFDERSLHICGSIIHAINKLRNMKKILIAVMEELRGKGKGLKEDRKAREEEKREKLDERKELEKRIKEQEERVRAQTRQLVDCWPSQGASNPLCRCGVDLVW